MLSCWVWRCGCEEKEACGTRWFADADGDGYGDPDEGTIACAQAEETVDNGDDCDDRDSSQRPGAEDTCDGATIEVMELSILISCDSPGPGMHGSGHHFSATGEQR